MTIQVIENKEKWNEYLYQCNKQIFLQTWEWGEFQKSLGYPIERVAIFDDNQLLVGITLTIIQPTFLGKYIYCPRGPLLTNNSEEQYKLVLQELKKYYQNKGLYSIKIDPGYVENTSFATIPQSIGFEHSTNFIQSETNWMIDLVGETEEDLLAWCKAHGMSKNYPTYIRKAKKENVVVEFSNKEEDWKTFHKYLAMSGSKKEFEVRPLDYFLNMYKTLGKDSNIARLGIAKRDGEILAMIIIMVYGEEIDCLYSAQTDIDTKLRAPMLLRWECMLQGQKEHIKRFNNWGVLPEAKYKPGVIGFGYSQYKRGFGGYLEQIERTYEYVYDTKRKPIEKLHEWYIKQRYYKAR